MEKTVKNVTWWITLSIHVPSLPISILAGLNWQKTFPSIETENTQPRLGERITVHKEWW